MERIGKELFWEKLTNQTKPNKLTNNHIDPYLYILKYSI